ncbi:hypothetical protein NXW89_19345 [Bacteroides thetaiotaomicron]|nr:hypothetical protein [Bacteroides thetaiotaomicron]
MDRDGSLLRGLMTMGGVDEDGGNVQTCRLVGTYRLTQSMSDEVRRHLCALPGTEYHSAAVCLHKNRPDGRGREKITNLDNSTGYDYNTEFTPSSHILEVLAKDIAFWPKDGGG